MGSFAFGYLFLTAQILVSIKKTDYPISYTWPQIHHFPDHLWLWTIYSYSNMSDYILEHLLKRCSLSAPQTTVPCTWIKDNQDFKAKTKIEKPLKSYLWGRDGAALLVKSSFLHLRTTLELTMSGLSKYKYIHTRNHDVHVKPNGDFWGRWPFDSGTCKHG
jgi:hypothetical protein